MDELFRNFTNQTGIELPKNILKNYLNGKNNNSEFARLFKSNFTSINEESKPHINILISEEFVLEILKLKDIFPKHKRCELLFQELNNHDIFYEGKKMIPDLNSEKLLIEEILCHSNDYDYTKNRFKFPLIQKAYENLNSNYLLMKVILILSGDCGGESGIIVRGKNVGFDIGYQHDQSSQIEFNGMTYEYNGYFFENYERLHKPIIENFR